MKDFNIQVRQKSGSIDTNFSELKAQLKQELAPYKNLTVSEDEISFAKVDLALLRRKKTEIDTRRKEVKKAYSEPLTKFEDSCKELTAIFDEAINNINDQLKLFEEDRIAHKRERIAKLYAEQVGEFAEFLPLEKNYNEKWDNKSYSDNDIIFDISALKQKVKADLDVIRSLNSEIEKEVIDTYKANGNNLASAITRNQQYIADKQKIEQAQKEAIEQATSDNQQAEVTENVVEEVKTATENVSPLEDTMLNDMVQMTKTAKIIISLDDLEQVKQTLSFMGVKYQVIE